jgi:outer membrane protein
MTNLTIAQARAVEEDLGRKRQNLLQYQETISQDLMREEAAITQELYEKVSSYLKTYGDENNLQVVLTYSAGSGLLYANDALNITDQVLSGLNSIYNGDNESSADSTVVQ